MSTPKIEATAAPIPAEIDPDSQTAADEAARVSKERKTSGVSASSSILTSGLDNDVNTKKNNLGA